MTAETWTIIAFCSVFVCGFALGNAVGITWTMHRLGFHWRTFERRPMPKKEG